MTLSLANSVSWNFYDEFSIKDCYASDSKKAKRKQLVNHQNPTKKADCKPSESRSLRYDLLDSIGWAYVWHSQSTIAQLVSNTFIYDFFSSIKSTFLFVFIVFSSPARRRSYAWHAIKRESIKLLISIAVSLVFMPIHSASNCWQNNSVAFLCSFPSEASQAVFGSLMRSSR